MHKTFSSLPELYDYIKEEKNRQGAEIGHHNRYPIRFVLFDNFVDFQEFIEDLPDNIYNSKLESLLDPDYPDTFISHSQLADGIIKLVKQLPANDFVVFPFSEMSRFFTTRDFESLVKTIRLKEPPVDSQEERIRLYIPIVGLQSKMSRFLTDNQSFVWEYRSNNTQGQYNLIITNGTTYGVTGFEQNYSLVENLSEWLKLWIKGANVKKNIICSSKSIFDTASYAQPDNAFNYIKCNNAYEFLTKGLKCDFGIERTPSPNELKYWEELASLIDIQTFDFDSFINERFDTFNLKNSLDFIKIWDECASDFDRWLLYLSFQKNVQGKGYISFAISKCETLTTSELFSKIATAIFDTSITQSNISERRTAMQLAVSKNIKLTKQAEQLINAKLEAIVSNPEQGIYTAMQLMTSLSESERMLMVQWVGEGRIKSSEIKGIFPDLYYYLTPPVLSQLGENDKWLNEYFDAYRLSKLDNRPNMAVSQLLKEYNANPASFRNWRDNFKTVRTILHNRTDIDVYYWIDGLGVDWIPFVSQVIHEYSKENVYLNEIYVATASIPTITARNKPALQSLLPQGETLHKIGDLDSFAHSNKTYPKYILDEMALVRRAISEVLTIHNGKKIAFISDHGVTYLSQHEQGMKIADMTPEHEGRLAHTAHKPVADSKYIVLEEENGMYTICSLTHASLTDKVTLGHGAHGGCTPEEVLVPIIIVSGQKNASNYSVNIVRDEIIGSNPVVDFIISGVNSIDTPELEYNGSNYELHNIGDGKYRSERLNLVDTATTVTMRIGESFKKTFQIKISTGALEDDIFGDLI